MSDGLKVALLWIGAFVGVALLGVGIWGFRVATSGIKGRGDTTIKNNSVQNRTGAQAEIRELYEAVQRNTTITQQAAALAAKHPDNRQYEMDATGAQQVCVTSVHSYNAATHKTLFQDWKDADLPWEIADSVCGA